jgi:hypothetical protein
MRIIIIHIFARMVTKLQVGRPAWVGSELQGFSHPFPQMISCWHRQ